MAQRERYDAFVESQGRGFRQWLAVSRIGWIIWQAAIGVEKPKTE